MNAHPKTVLALDIGSRTLLWAVARCRGQVLSWGEAGMKTLELGRLLQNPSEKTTVVADARQTIIVLGKRFSLAVEEKAGVLTGALREMPMVAKELIASGELVGINITVISAEEEGRLAWLGASDLFANGVGAVLDLGGHTAQLSLGEATGFCMLGSLPLGCQTLTQRFLLHDPVRSMELAHLKEYVNEKLEGSDWKLPGEVTLVGTGGTAAAWAGITVGAKTFQPERIHGFKMDRSGGDKLLAELLPLTQEELRQRLPFDTDRAGVFLAGLWALLEAMRFLDRKEMYYSAYSVRHGLAKRILGFE